MQISFPVNIKCSESHEVLASDCVKSVHTTQVRTSLLLLYSCIVLVVWVGIATHYGRDGPGVESWWRQVFPHPSTPALGSTQPPIPWIPGLSRDKAAGAWH
jgi:hypothetical protein